MQIQKTTEDELQCLLFAFFLNMKYHTIIGDLAFLSGKLGLYVSNPITMNKLLNDPKT